MFIIPISLGSLLSDEEYETTEKADNTLYLKYKKGETTIEKLEQEFKTLLNSN